MIVCFMYLSLIDLCTSLSVLGYGQTGPVAQRSGYDSIAAAVSGLMHITGHEDGEPVRPGVAMTDLATGLYTYGAIMAGLLQRYKTGKGLHIDCNLLSTQVACLTHVAANYLNCKIEARRWGTAHGSIVPYQAFKTKDGYIVVGAGNDHQFVTVCKILNLPEVSKDSRYKTNTLRVQNRKELIDIFSSRFSEKATMEWLQLFEGSGVPYGPINNMQQVFSDPQERCSIQPSDHLHGSPYDLLQQVNVLPVLKTPNLDTILQVPLDGIPSFRHANSTIQLGVICKLDDVLYHLSPRCTVWVSTIMKVYASSAVSNAAKDALDWYKPKREILGVGWNNARDDWKQCDEIGRKRIKGDDMNWSNGTQLAT
ncbi:PREDICTED: succinate--hydroxymethylglutarate CoA-transferase, partial [Acanthisitta chloris]|uniref:succinate--hydroxymethylglutarate CoA-transferase n=1 Tax=Acanthisitta chloris TaxID=57068 RepID=UPI0004F0D090